MLWQGFALVLGGAFLHAFYQVMNKKLLVKQAPADCVSTINFLGSGTILLILAFVLNPPKIQSWFDWPSGLIWPLAATCLLNIIIGFGNIRALKYGDASLITPISAAQPMIVLIPSVLILNEIPGFWGYLGLLLLAVGMYIFSFAEEVKGWECPPWLRWMGKFSRYVAPWQMLFKNKGVKIALFVACCGAVAINFDKLAVMKSSATFAPGFILVFCGLVGLVKTSIAGEWKKLEKSHTLQLLTNPVVWVFVMICYWSAFHYGFAAYIGSLKRINVVFVLILAFLILKEKNAKKRWPGAVIMAIGAALLSL